MSCSDTTTCPDGNCVGCKDGEKWCQDPRCHPYCPNCPVPEDNDFAVTIVFFIAIICLVGILILIMVGYGPKFIHQNKSKNIQQNTDQNEKISANNPQNTNISQNASVPQNSNVSQGTNVQTNKQQIMPTK